MALAYKLLAVDNGGVAPNDPADLTLSGQLRVVVGYIDDAAPAVILRQENFYVSSTESAAAIEQRVIANGQKIRDARQRITQLSGLVGVVRPIP